MTTSVLKNLSDEIIIGVYLHRDLHDNGMTLKDYANAVIEGTQPILDHNDYVYQFGSTEDNTIAVSDFFQDRGFEIVEASRVKGLIRISGTVENFNKTFNITLLDVTDDSGRTYMMHDDAITVPADIASMVEQVLGFDQSFIAKKHAVVCQDISNPLAGAVTPVQMATAYNMPSGDGYGGCIGIFELTYSAYVTGYNQTDVNNSFSRIGLSAPTIVQINVDGATASTTSDLESMLDIYCAGAIAPRAKIAYYTGPNTGTASINDIFLTVAADTTNNPTVLDVSWGIGDGSQYDTALQSCVVKGITVFVSSGDNGAVNLSVAASCTSPYMVSAGGTTINLNGSNQITSEVAWSGSGGGISASVPLPSWQIGLTATTITATGTGAPTAIGFRGIPDISAPADPNTGYQYFVNGVLQTVGGTSAAAPLLAGMWARLNAQLGFRIPFNMAFWYNNATLLFNDIVSGNNRDGYITGYTTTTGWDAVTGLGSPKANQIYKYFHIGSTFPKQNYGFRPAVSGPAYPRRTTGAR
jgi:kumamolisin